jgi:nucleotide-binding universal stress UspA family protein
MVAETADPIVCMTTHGYSGLGQVLLGSVAEEVIGRVRSPLLLVGPSVDPDLATTFDTVVVCTDGSDDSRSIVPVASDWIRGLRLRAWVVQVLDPDVRRELEKADEALVETNAAYALAQGLIHRDGGGVNWDVLHGEDVPDAIVDYASGLPASLIAMATHGRSGLARFALGSVAASVVHSARCPVLVVRPDGLRNE